MPEIQAYHIEVFVHRDSEYFRISATLPDYCSDADFLHDLGRELNVNTAGELVDALESRGFESPVCEDCKVESTEVLPHTAIDWESGI